MDEQILENTPALPPHKYPMWIKLFGIGLIIATFYSLALLPEYLNAAKKMHAARIAFGEGNYDEAILWYRDVLETVPTSKKALIGAAEALFSNSDKSDDEIGLALLGDVTLDKYAWARIQKVMPADYQQYFENVKK